MPQRTLTYGSRPKLAGNRTKDGMSTYAQESGVDKRLGLLPQGQGGPMRATSAYFPDRALLERAIPEWALTIYLAGGLALAVCVRGISRVKQAWIHSQGDKLRHGIVQSWGMLGSVEAFSRTS